MKKFKHNKIKNTAILFELLSKQVAADVLSDNGDSALTIIKRFFNSSTELSKELGCYYMLSETVNKRENSAFKLIDSTLQYRKALDLKKLNSEKYKLINELRNAYDIKLFFDSRIANYKLYAATYKLFEYNSSDNPTAHISSYETLVEHITSTSKKNIVTENRQLYDSQDPDIKSYAFKLIVERFNKKYKNLNVKQKSLINKFITENTTQSPFKSYFRNEILYIQKEINSLKKSITDKSLEIKLNESVNLLNEIITSNRVKDEHISVMLKFYELIDVLNG